jgi:nucleotide-binding universal stress UspA family protein
MKGDKLIMYDIKKILVPVDGSPASIKASERAIEIAKKYGSEITFLSVANTPDMFNIGDYSFRVHYNYDNVVNNHKLAQAEILDKVIEGLDIEGVKFEKKVVSGEPAEEIIRMAHDCQYDYIVMGRRGFSKFTRFFVGSVTQRVIAESPCAAVIVVNE